MDLPPHGRAQSCIHHPVTLQRPLTLELGGNHVRLEMGVVAARYLHLGSGESPFDESFHFRGIQACRPVGNASEGK